MLKFAVPNKGRLFDKTVKLLEEAGFVFDLAARKLSASVANFGMEILFLRTDDIPVYLESGIVDLGITGLDLVHEHGADLAKLLELDYGRCKIIVAAPEGKYASVEDLPRPARIATGFVNTAQTYFASKGVEVEIADIHGAVEISPRLGLADAIVDITSSGATLAMNELEILDTILVSEACLFASRRAADERSADLDFVVRSVKSVLDAHGRKYVMANLPAGKLEEAKAVLPGITAPSVLPLSGLEDVVAVHAVIHQNEVNRVVGDLRALGGVGILVMNIERIFE